MANGSIDDINKKVAANQMSMLAQGQTYNALGINTDLNSLFTSADLQKMMAQYSSTNGSGNIFDMSSYQNQMNDAINSAMKSAKRQMTIQNVTSAVTTLGGLFAQFATIRAMNGAASQATSVVTNNGIIPSSTTTTTATSASTDFGFSNQLTSAISAYQNNGTSENWQALVNQISVAENDRTKVKDVMAEQDKIIKAYPAQESALKQEIEAAKQEKLAALKEVDAVRDGIKAATRKKTITETEIPAQNDIIAKSKEKVESANNTYKTTEQEQNAIINQKTPDLQAMKTETYTETDATGNTVQKQRQVPDTQKREAAQKAIDEAKAKIQKAKEDYEKVLEAEVGSKEAGTTPTESSVQGKANAQIKALEAEVEEKDKIIAASGSTQEELEAKQKAYTDAMDKEQAKKDELSKLTAAKNEAVTKYGAAQSQDKTLEKEIAQANKLMTSKKK